tara:strand:+ start:12 stop:512 length:501 start_codon:yes stop_codon:yes gene_type:complete
MTKRILLLFTILFFNLSLIAQTKVAHIDTYELITSMPEMLEVQKQLEQYGDKLQNDIREMEAALRSKIELYQSEVPNKSDNENKERLEEIQGMEDNIRLYMNQVFQDMQKKEQELTKPILDRAIKTIQEVGKENGFDYVLDSTKNQGVLLADGYDLMEKVKIKLGF